MALQNEQLLVPSFQSGDTFKFKEEVRHYWLWLATCYPQGSHFQNRSLTSFIVRYVKCVLAWSVAKMKVLN